MPDYNYSNTEMIKRDITSRQEKLTSVTWKSTTLQTLEETLKDPLLTVKYQNPQIAEIFTLIKSEMNKRETVMIIPSEKCDKAYLESLKDKITWDYDNKLLNNVITQWSEKSTIRQQDVQVQDSTLYLCGYNITDSRKYQKYSKLKNPTYIIEQWYQGYFKSLLELTQKLTGKTLNFPWDKFKDAKFDGKRPAASTLNEELNNNRDFLDSIYHILGKETTIPLWVENNWNVIHCVLWPNGRFFNCNSTDNNYNCPVVSKF